MVYVDFSAGRNEFANDLLGLPYYSVDLYSYPQTKGLVHPQDFLALRRAQVFPQGRPPLPVVLGLNPPFGKRCGMITRFLRHGFEEFRPHWLLLIVPNSCVLPREVAPWYDEVLVVAIRGNAFYRPDNPALDANVGVWCQFRIYRLRAAARASTGPQQVVVAPFTIYPLDQLYSKITTEGYRPDPPDRYWIMRRWGRLAGRRFLEPAADGTIWEWGEDERAPVAVHQGWAALQSALSGATFWVIEFPAARPQDLRVRWLEEWRVVSPQYWDPAFDKQKFINHRKVTEVLGRIVGAATGGGHPLLEMW
jgi:hypothetical protein